MKPVFCDTVYFLALLNSSDQLHTSAVTFSRNAQQPLVTTEWILTEVGDALWQGANREKFGRLLAILSRSPSTKLSEQTLHASNVAAIYFWPGATRNGRSPIAFLLWSCKTAELPRP